MKKVTVPQTWFTHDKRKVSLDSVDHSHLSNIYWYYIIIFNLEPTNIIDEINKRFGGVIMDYAPIIKEEIDFLKRNGFVMHGIGNVGIIVYNSKRVGYIK